MTPASQEWPNLFPDRLDFELNLADELGVKTTAPGTVIFDRMIGEGIGRIKWVVTTAGELLVIPFEVGGTELAHTVASKGADVWAAGEAEVAGSAAGYFGIEITNRSGHYQPSESCLGIARLCFSRFGIEFPP